MVKFIAEICSNHNGDLDRAIKLICQAADIGCAGVKFQLFRIDQLFAPELLNNPRYEYVNKRRAWELPLDWLPILSSHCRLSGLEFGCTPFYLEAVEALAPYVNFLKIASYELLWGELLSRCLDTHKPVYMSTGMATMDEIKAAIYHQIKTGRDPEHQLMLLHCISQYPVSPESCHLSFIGALRVRIGAKKGVGYSDHSVNPGVIHRAIHRYGAEVIEFHLDLDDRAGVEYSGGHCWTPSQIAPVISQVRDGILADGSKTYDPTTNPERDFRADSTDGLRPMREMREVLIDD